MTDADTATAEQAAPAGAAPAALAPQPMPLAAQLAKLERILGDRVRHYRTGVAKGRLTLDAAAVKHAECMAILASFRWLAANAAWVRAEARMRAEARARAEAHAALAAEMAEEPAVAAVLAAFPGAAIVDVQPLGDEPDAIADATPEADA